LSITEEALTVDLFANPQLLSLLDASKQAPEQDALRLVLADWLDDQGETSRAEFIRLQRRLGPGNPPLSTEERASFQDRSRQLLSRHGGAWAGSLWRWSLPLTWHRGLLSVPLPRRFDAAAVVDVLPWIDTLRFHITGWQRLRQAIDLLALADGNHVSLDLRAALGEDGLLDVLARLEETPSLRSLTIDWPLRLLQHVEAGESGTPSCTPAVSEGFLRRLLLECPIGRHLTHLASCWAFNADQAIVIRGLGVEPVHAEQPQWMHAVPPIRFRRRPG
jgi:uncharacterized protein (TIGR02996 family)